MKKADQYARPEQGEEKASKEVKRVKIAREGAEQYISHNISREDKIIYEIVKATDQFSDLPESREEKIRILSKAFGRALGIPIKPEECPDHIGFAPLTALERKILFGLMELFQDSGYKGNESRSSQREKDDFEERRRMDPLLYSVVGAYDNIEYIPVIRVSLTDLMKVCGLTYDSGFHRRRTEEALGNLARNKSFCLWYRYGRNAEGKFLIGPDGKKVRYPAVALQPAINLRMTEKPGREQMYSFELNPVLMDMITDNFGGGRYGIFFPVEKDWEKQVDNLLEKKKRGPAPSAEYVKRFIWWLMLQQQDMYFKTKPRPGYRRGKNGKPEKVCRKPTEGDISVKIGFEQLCLSICIKEEEWKKNRKRVEGTIDKAIKIAEELGYFTTPPGRPLYGEYKFSLAPFKFRNDEQEAPEEEEEIPGSSE